MAKELTPQAALERLHTSTEGMQLPAPDDNPPWLNRLDTVDGIVRGFALALIERYGDLDQDEFTGWLQAECDRLNELFLGFKDGEKRADYQRSIWNMPQNLGRSIGPNLRIDCETHKAVRDAFMVTAANLIEILNAGEGKPIEDWGWQMDAQIEALQHGLLGLPASEPEE